MITGMCHRMVLNGPRRVTNGYGVVSIAPRRLSNVHRVRCQMIPGLV
jgi:hypothetical protein